MRKYSLLEKRISEASQKYYTDGTSDVSDEQFDSMLSDLKSVDPSNPLVTSVGHGYSVDKDTTYGEKVEHKYGLVGSLEKVHNWYELSDKLKEVQVLCSLKLDGISCVLYYENSELVRALTRGDGHLGIDITDKVLVFAPSMKALCLDGFTGAIRGELVMKFDRFSEYKSTHTDAKNPRNTVAGLINRKQVSPSDLKYVSLIVYSILASGNTGYVLDYATCMNTLSLVCQVAPYVLVPKLSESTFDETMKSVHSKFEVFRIPNDGVVIASNSIVKSRSDKFSEFVTSWDSQAYKFPAERKQTSITEVEWNLTKTGYLVPKIKFDQVELSGTTVEYATAFNAKYVKDNNLQTGAVVTVTKSGEIIPYVVSVDSTPESEAKLPSTCPSCGSELGWNGVHLCCENTSCPGKSMIDTVIWMKTISPVDGLSDTLIEKYLSFLGVSSVSDIYKSNVTFSPRPESKQDSLFETCWNGCFENRVTLATAVKACNVPRFGDKTCQLFNDKETAETLLQSLRAGHITYVTEPKLRNLGNANFESLVSNFEKVMNVLYIVHNVYVPDDEKRRSKGDVCVTGKLSVKRSEFEQELITSGYNPVSSVKSSTSFLVTDNPNSGSSKNKSADKYGVPKVTEEEFREKYM